jgi:hypothetical protein
MAPNLEAMRRGKQRAVKVRQREAAQRVKAFTKWLDAGSPKGSMPRIPSDADYRAVGQR